MKLGAVYPQKELGGSPDAVRAVGQAVEDLGYDHLVAYDHVLGAADSVGPYTDRDPFHDPLTLFAYLAGRHESLGFATGILILPQRQTALVARQAADVALLSGGRLRLGVGAGWNPVEYEALGQDFTTRGARMDEQIPLLRRYFSGELVTFEGRFDRVERAALNPPPADPIPIWVGGHSPAALRRGARLGDGFIFAGPLETVVEAWSALQGLLREEGRAVEGFGAETTLRSSKGAAVLADAVLRWGDAGGTHASISTMDGGLDSVEAHIDLLGQVAARLS